MRRSPRLQRAIKLREWVRHALAEKDAYAVLNLNRLADKAYTVLTPKEARAYREWAELTPEKAKEFWDQVGKLFDEMKKSKT